ncbi:MAG: hypothetical protein M3299_09320 [Thermoproteota archaeon]|nr:hypothetical protein [Thermoproteota archaeon]
MVDDKDRSRRETSRQERIACKYYLGQLFYRSLSFFRPMRTKKEEEDDIAFNH